MTVINPIKNYFITTPIYYVNALPHIGHMYTTLLADALHRFNKLLGTASTVFSTGTDEHGIKVQQASASAGINEIKFCTDVSATYKQAFDSMDISYTDFIRTTEIRHSKAVNAFWERLKQCGFIEKGKYSGWYSVPDESFLTLSQVTEIERHGQKVMISSDSGHEVMWTEEDNYVFDLDRLRSEVRHWIKSKDPIYPSKFGELVLMWLDSPLPSLSVSRPVSRVHWGIPVPDDPKQMIYVWVDALINYLTVSGYPDYFASWPPDVQLIGKDILRFHGVYWPALLIAAGFEPPHRLICHSHWTVDQQKMSKSLGNVISIDDALNHLSADGVRYYLLRKGVLHSDSNFQMAGAIKFVNAELADTLGNLLNRCTSLSVNKNQCRQLPVEDYEPDLMKFLRALPDMVCEEYQNCHFYRGLELIMAVLRQTNQYIDRKKPWEMAKLAEQSKDLEMTVAVALEVLRVTGILLQPIVPNLARRMLDKLAVSDGERQWSNASYCDVQSVQLSSERCKLFAKIR